jgi:hypothetical protein
MEGEKVSSCLSVLEMNRERKKITVVGQAWRYKYPQRIRRFFAGCFGWV